MRLGLFFVFFSVTPFMLIAQQQYLFSHLHTHDGLASETVNAVAQDDKGFIWIAGNNGLQRYDGKSFLTFQHKEDDKTSLPYSRVTWLKKDMKNRLWLLLEDNKIGYFNTSNFSFHEVPVHASEADLHRFDGRLFTDSLGYVIFLLGNVGIYTYSEKRDEFSSAYNPLRLPENWKPVWLSYNHQYKNYWIGCLQGLVKYNVQSKTVSYRDHNTDNDSIIKALSSLETIIQTCYDRSGKFWMVSWPFPKGITILSYDEKTNVKQEWQNAIYALNRGWYFEVTTIYEQQNGDVWLTGPNLFARFNRNKNNFDFMRDNLPGEYSLYYDGVNSIFEDREHNIWICSNKGLYRFNTSAQQFHIYNNRRYDKDTVLLPGVNDFLRLLNGDLLVGTWGNGLFAYDSDMNPVHRNYIDQSLKLYEGMVWCIHQRKNGDIWRGNQGGYLYIYFDSAKTTKLLKPEILNQSTIRQIEEDSAGDLWLGMQSGLIVKWKAATNTFVKMNKFNSPVNRLYIDSQDNVWACLRNEGAFRLNNDDGKILSAYTSTAATGKKLMRSNADDIIQYNDSIFLIASGGVNVLNIRTGNIRFINPKNQLFSNTVSNLVKDKNGIVWIGSQSGLYYMDMKTEVATDFNENDGIQPDAINTGSSYTMKDGSLAFGREHDFVLFNPDTIRRIDFTPPVVTITGFKLMNNPLLVDSLSALSAIQFPYNRNAVTIKFSTLSYQNKYAVHYKLEGLDKDWITNENNEAVYSYIPPGTYTFKAYAQNSEGVESKKVTELMFTIAAPFWNTWWFYSLLVLLVAALFYWFDKARMKRKAAIQLMRSHISDNLHAEVNDALQDINILSEIASIKAHAEPEQSKNYISEINYKSRSTITAMDDMLWSIDPANDTMDKFIARAKEFAASISYSKNAVVHVQADRQVLLLKPDMKWRHELLMIYKTALNWLVNEMEARHITTQLNQINGQLQLNLFAADIKPSVNDIAAINKKLCEHAAAIKAMLDILNDEKGVGIMLNVRV